MKLLSVFLARSVWLGNLRDFNPRGKSLTTLLITYLLESYKFIDYPILKPNEPLDDTKGIVFSRGEFVNRKGETIEVKLSIFNFGIVAETGSSTSDSDYFLETLLAKLHEKFGLVHYSQLVNKKDYLSQVYVSTEKNLNILNPKLNTIVDYLNSNITVHGEVDYQVGGISFWANPVKSVNPLPFTFERQATAPFAENRYFSSVPLSTEKHLELLDKLEDILS